MMKQNNFVIKAIAILEASIEKYPHKIFIKTLQKIIKDTVLTKEVWQKLKNSQSEFPLFDQWVLNVMSELDSSEMENNSYYTLGFSIPVIIVSIFGENKYYKLLEKVADKYGRYIARKIVTKFEYVLMFRILDVPQVKVPNTLYHFSFLENLDRILQKGILPISGKHDNFLYPERIFLSKEYDLKYFKSVAMQKVYPNLNNYSKVSQPPIVVFEVDTTKLEKAIFHEDHDMEKNIGLWTKDRIPSEALKVIYKD